MPCGASLLPNPVERVRRRKNPARRAVRAAVMSGLKLAGPVRQVLTGVRQTHLAVGERRSSA